VPLKFGDERLIATLNDPLLLRLIAARDDDERAAEIQTLIVDHAMPAMARVLSLYERSPRPLRREDMDDIVSAVSLRLVQRLQIVPLSVDGAIRNFADFVAVAACNAVHDLLRNRDPERTRVERRLRYLFTHDGRLATWDSPAGPLCGLATWSDTADFDDQEPALPVRAALTGDALVAVFEENGAPLRLHALIDAAATSWTEGDPSAVVVKTIADDRPGQHSQLESRQLVNALWDEIRQLPPKQRTALLLNLREGAGVNPLGIFVLTGVATLDDLAEAIGIEAAALPRFWNRLPLDDLAIASIMGVTRQQVINFRKSARERLRRRMGRRK
jgi:RNA polymerase sigma factor (sigma-70 family)